jgi:hypothetical protein
MNLLSMTDEEVSKMSMSALKTILFQNHVNAHLLLEKSDLVECVRALLDDVRQDRAREAAIHAQEEERVTYQHAMMEEYHLQKEQDRAREATIHAQEEELVAYQHAMMEECRLQKEQDRTREAAIRAQEEELVAYQHAMMEECRLRKEQARRERELASRNKAEQPESKLSSPPMMGTAVDLEQNGLCVVCQDEEANIAIVDCGYAFVTRGKFSNLHTTNGRLVVLQSFGDVSQLL